MAPAALLWRRLTLSLTLVVWTSGLAVGAPLGTSFTYQGVLSSGGEPLDGVVDLRFGLYDVAEGGVSLATVAVDDVSVVDGIVNAVLDFGDRYDGAALWLEVGVRDGAGTGAYEVVAPRQPLRAHPRAAYAILAEHVSSADSASAAVDTDALDGINGGGLLAWSALTGVPEDLADGDDDMLADLGCDPGQIAVVGSGGWQCGSDSGGFRTVVVGPVGDAAANGAALLAAVTALPTPSSQEEAWRVEVEPGRYDLGSASLVLKPWIVLAGSGEGNTVVTSSHCSASGGDGATLVGAAGVLIRDLDVENTCSSATDDSIAIRLRSTDTLAAIEHVTARAVGSASFAGGVVSQGAGAQLHRLTAEAGSSSTVHAAIVCAASAFVTDSSGEAVGGDLAVGLAVGSPSELDPTAAVVSRGTFTASGATSTHGVQVTSARADLELLTVAGGEGVTIDNDFGVNAVHASRLVATGPVVVDHNGGSVDVKIEQSRIMATGPTVSISGTPIAVQVAASQLWGAAASGSASCAGVWDESWVFYASTCP